MVSCLQSPLSKGEPEVENLEQKEIHEVVLPRGTSRFNKAQHAASSARILRIKA